MGMLSANEATVFKARVQPSTLGYASAVDSNGSGEQSIRGMWGSGVSCVSHSCSVHVPAVLHQLTQQGLECDARVAIVQSMF
jgi:hypothetical protein